jgi:molybdenum cofactor guanylyltransferase
MGRDKAALDYHGRPQLQWTYELLGAVCQKVFVSVRADQTHESTRSSLPQIVDAHPSTGPIPAGPIAGISAALDSNPEAAWLVLACDLPFVSTDTLDHLVTHRDTTRIATAYRSSHDDLPEPLCAIWEPQAREAVTRWIALGKQCPRKLLINSDVALLEQPHPRALDNINTPDEYALAHSSASTHPDA